MIEKERVCEQLAHRYVSGREDAPLGHEDLMEEDLVFDTLDSLGLRPSCMVPMVCNTDEPWIQ